MNERPNRVKVFAPWKILIVDDDPDVHEATRMALRGVEFRGRSLEFIDAYSGTQALDILQENPDTAIVLLDVIMETDDAGLCAALRIRESGFKLVRIIVRTGFPGQAPERKVIVDYDIHDYKEKTGLSVQKLFSSVISALRAYDDLVALEEHRRGLMGVLDAASSFDFNAVQGYVSRMLAEFTGLARLGSDNIVAASRPAANGFDEPRVLASFGSWQDVGEPGCMADLSPEISSLMFDSFSQRQALSGSVGKTLFAHNRGIDLVVFATGADAFSQVDEVLLEMFLMSVCQAISNQKTFAEVLGDRDAVLRSLALRGERWNENAAVEMDRLSSLATALATRLHITLSFADVVDSHFIQCIGVASMLHDIGNEAVPISLLSKQSAYEPPERKLMQVHVAAGVALVDEFLLGMKKSGALSMARDIIEGHHEFFDGSGYPNGLCGDAIPLAARVVAVADAYVAMTSARPHRAAFDAVTARALIQKSAGNQFDPRVVDAFLDVMVDGFGN